MLLAQLRQKIATLFGQAGGKTATGNPYLGKSPEELGSMLIQEVIHHTPAFSLLEEHAIKKNFLGKKMPRLGVDALKNIIAAGAHLDSTHTGKYQATALHWAVTTDLGDIVQCLIDAGAPISQKDSDGNTALDLAHKHGKQAYVTLLQNAEEALKAKQIAEVKGLLRDGIPFTPPLPLRLNTARKAASRGVMDVH